MTMDFWEVLGVWGVLDDVWVEEVGSVVVVEEEELDGSVDTASLSVLPNAFSSVGSGGSGTSIKSFSSCPVRAANSIMATHK